MPAQGNRRNALFEAYGFGVHYAVVDKTTLAVVPVPGELLAAARPDPTPGTKRDVEAIAGIAAHAIEIRNERSMRKPAKWGRKITARIAALSSLLERHQALLLPGGAHPLYVPARDGAAHAAQDRGPRTTYARLFDMDAHGWSNDGSLRLDIRFDKPSDFSKLHAAVRLLLPIIPGLTAASPILEGRPTGSQSARLEAYFAAREGFPALVGGWIPEAVFDQEEHDREILVPIAQALASYDRDGSLDPTLLNARAATVNFDRGILSLHVLDAQESASANMAVAEFIITVLKAMVAGRWVSTYLQRAWSVDDLHAILASTIKDGDEALITNADYQLMFGLMKQGHMPVIKLWQQLFVEVYGDLSTNARSHVAHILEHGTLARRILRATGDSPSPATIHDVYTTLAKHLPTDTSYA